MELLSKNIAIADFDIYIFEMGVWKQSYLEFVGRTIPRKKDKILYRLIDIRRIAIDGFLIDLENFTIDGENFSVDDNDNLHFRGFLVDFELGEYIKEPTLLDEFYPMDLSILTEAQGETKAKLIALSKAYLRNINKFLDKKDLENIEKYIIR